MSTTTTTKAPLFIQARHFLGITHRSHYRPGRQQVILDEVAVAAREGHLPYSMYTAAYGVAYARQSGRLSAQVDEPIQLLSPYRFLQLLSDIAEIGLSINEIPAYLIGRFGG